MKKSLTFLLFLVIPLALFAFASHPRGQMVGPGGALVDTSMTPAAIVMQSNTLIAHWNPSVTPNVLQYCVYESQIAGKEVKQLCAIPAKFACPAIPPPLVPPIAAGQL